jgi:hypothetical protein
MHCYPVPLIGRETMIIELKWSRRYLTLETIDRETGEDVGYVDHDKGTQVYRDSWRHAYGGFGGGYECGKRFGVVIGATLFTATWTWYAPCRAMI